MATRPRKREGPSEKNYKSLVGFKPEDGIHTHTHTVLKSSKFNGLPILNLLIFSTFFIPNVLYKQYSQISLYLNCLNSVLRFCFYKY